MLCNWLLKGEVSARYVPLGALGISLFTFDLYAATAHMQGGSGALLDVAGFLSRPSAWRVLSDLMMIAVSAGFYIVPLNTLLQARSEESHRSRVIAANNIVNALFMVLGAIGAVAMLAFHCSIPEIFLALALVNLPVALYICRLLPETVIKGLVGGLLRLAYGAEVHGLANWPAPAERVVVVANHVSFLDAVLLAALLPGRPTFAVNSFIAKRWWARIGLSLVDSFPLDPTKPLAAKSLIREVQAGRRCVIFPEGRITVTGALMKIYEGPGMIADKAGARILPVRIDGAQYTPFSRLRGKLRLRLVSQDHAVDPAGRDLGHRSGLARPAAAPGSRPRPLRPDDAPGVRDLRLAQDPVPDPAGGAQPPWRPAPDHRGHAPADHDL